MLVLARLEVLLDVGRCYLLGVPCQWRHGRRHRLLTTYYLLLCLLLTTYYYLLPTYYLLGVPSQRRHGRRHRLPAAISSLRRAARRPTRPVSSI